MAATGSVEVPSGCKGYWQTIQLKYSDGPVIQATLDMPTIRRLKNGDNTLMENIRRNVKVSENRNSLENAADFQNASDNIDIEANKEGQTYMHWPPEAVKLLISLYKEYESEMENPMKRKTCVWQIITKKINEAGFPLTQNRVECKWRNMLQSHKDIRDNKNKSGQKRKSFQYYEEIEDIVGKRHDINPPFTSGSLINNDQKKKFKTHTPQGSAVDFSNSLKDSSPTSANETESNGETIIDQSGNIESKAGSSKQKVNKRQQKEPKDNEKVLHFLMNMEKKHQEEHEENERKKEI